MNRSEITVKLHFLNIARFLYPYLTLLIIPVARGVFLYLFYNKGTLLGVLSAEGVILVLAVFLAVIKLKHFKLYFNGDITVQKGLFCRVRYSIPESKSRVVVIESNPILKVFGAARLKIYTEAGNRKIPDENVLVGEKTAMSIFKNYGVQGQVVKSNTFGEVIMSAALSSFTAGVLLTIPAVKVIMSILGQSLPSLVPTAKGLYFENFGFRELGRWVTVLLIAGYIISFIVLFLRNFGFYSVKSNSKIMLSSGRMPRRTAFLNTKSVRAVRIVTVPLMLMVKKCAVKFSACGYGRLKGEIGLLVPCVKPTLAKGLVSWLLPRFKKGAVSLKPDKRAARRIIWLPMVLSSVSVSGLVLARLLNMHLFEFAVLISAALMVSAIILFLMRFHALKNGGFWVSESLISVKGMRGFSFDELQVKKEAVQCIRISRTPFDLRHGHCTVKLRVKGKNRETMQVKYLAYSDVTVILRNSFYDSFNRFMT